MNTSDRLRDKRGRYVSRETQRRHEAAVRGAETRRRHEYERRAAAEVKAQRARYAKESARFKRRQAALKGWETRRAKAAEARVPVPSIPLAQTDWQSLRDLKNLSGVDDSTRVKIDLAGEPGADSFYSFDGSAGEFAQSEMRAAMDGHAAGAWGDTNFYWRSPAGVTQGPARIFQVAYYQDKPGGGRGWSSIVVTLLPDAAELVAAVTQSERK